MDISPEPTSSDTLPRVPGAPRYAELHCLSNYTFLTGASHPEELVETAAARGYEGIAITDDCSLSGIVKAHQAAKACGIKLVVGAELNFDDGLKLVLLAPHRRAYGELSSLITRARRRSPKGEYRLTLDDLDWGVAECLALWIPGDGDIQALLETGHALAHKLGRWWIALELTLNGTDIDRAAHALTLSMRLEVPIVASTGALMHDRARKPLQDVLTAIRERTPVSDLGSALSMNRERHLRTLDALAKIYPREMLTETIDILDLCHFSLDELRYEYPEELVPPHLGPCEHLRQLTFEGASARWPDGIPGAVRALIEKELALVAELGYEHYFLTVHDIVQFARAEGILCQGRGSAANSAVCYCLHVTEVDPARMHLLFERFVSRERDEPPDIDVDFEHERREEVIQYIYKRYSRERAALAATLITYRPKSAVRDVGKALGLDPDLIDALAKSLAWWDGRAVLRDRLEAQELDAHSPAMRRFSALIEEILGFPRHLSQHVGGFVISRGPLAQLVPIENAAMAERTVIQWDKDDLEALGLLKVDVLGLGMLTAIRKALAGINAWHGTSLTLGDVPAEDPETYRMLQRGDSVGVFQVESRAQMSMLPRLKPSNFYDLVIQVAIVRPGPIQGDMVHPYLRRRQGLETVSYHDDGVRRVLERTLGVPIFQEQVIELAMVAAGFGAGEADRLRRAMAAWRRRGELESFEHKLIDGMLERGHERDFAERLFAQIKGFGEYGFPESHAASFALLVYVSAWLKRHHPAAFYCGLLNSLPMGFYSPSQLLQDARRHDIEARTVDVQHSTWDHRLEACPGRQGPVLRLGLRLIKGLREEAAARIETGQPFAHLDDLAERARLDRQSLGFLARAGALESVSGHRYQSHWEAAAIHPRAALWQAAEPGEAYDSGVRLTPPSASQDMMHDYRYLGLTLGPHPMRFLRGHSRLDGCRPASELERCHHGQFVRVAGVVTCRQRPSTASGVVFITLEDETGNSNLVIWTSVLERYRGALLGGQLLKAKGVVEREGEVIHVVVGEAEDVTPLLEGLSLAAGQDAPFHSRNFH